MSRRLITAITVLLAVICGLVATHQALGLPKAATHPVGELVAERSILIDGTLDGAARITDPDGDLIADYAAGEAIFITTIDRALRHQRAKRRADPRGPYLLRLRESGNVTVFDPSTGKEIALASYGQDNVAAFAALIPRPN